MTEKNITVPFNLRYGQNNDKPVSDNFPSSARIGLVYAFEDIIRRGYIIQADFGASWQTIITELYRIAKIKRENPDRWEAYEDEFYWLLEEVEWHKVYSFCERVYDRFLTQVVDTESLQISITIEDVKKYFLDEINNLLYEENLDYRFVNGIFERAGRVQTQKNIRKMGEVLSNSELGLVKSHYNKALKFFNEKPSLDINNCVKEAMCALESCIEIKTGKNVSKNFTKEIRDLQKSNLIEIHPAIVESIIKIYALRGDSPGVAHGSIEGKELNQIEAELILNLVASYITYIVDLIEASKEEVPF